MKKITLEKVLWFVGRLIRAVFLIAWNLTKMAFALFLVFLGMAGEHARAIEEEGGSGNSEDVGAGIRNMSDWIWDD